MYQLISILHAGVQRVNAGPPKPVCGSSARAILLGRTRNTHAAFVCVCVCGSKDTHVARELILDIQYRPYHWPAEHSCTLSVIYHRAVLFGASFRAPSEFVLLA